MIINFMKTINKFLLEKLVITNNSKVTKKQLDCPSEIVKIPVCDDENNIVYKNTIWKELELPTSPYIIYKDKYRGDKPHFNTTDDFITSICLFEDDYEDFNPSKDILYTSNDLEDILKWYFNYIGIKELPNKNNIDEWESKYGDNFLDKTNDNGHVMGEIYSGIDTYYNNPKYKNIHYKTDLDDILKTYFDIKLSDN